MNSKPKISIIMPIYNVELYINRAIDSVLTQTFDDFELIIINSGSTDNTKNLCLKYAEIDARINFIDLNENIGPGLGRNMGLDVAQGQYIMFMDGDDYIDSDMLEVLYHETMEYNVDLVICGYYQDFVDEKEHLENTIHVVPSPLYTKCKSETLQSIPFLDIEKVLSFSWNKLYNASIIRKNSVRFPDKLHSEDYFFVIDLMKYINELKTIEKPFYHYIKRKKNSLTNQAYHKNFLNLMNERFMIQVEMLKKDGLFEGKTRKMACSEHIKNIFLALENECAEESGLNAKERRKKIKELLTDSYVQEAIQYSGDVSKVIMLLNRIIRTQNAPIIDFFAYIIWFMRNKMSGMYHKIKVK